MINRSPNRIAPASSRIRNVMLLRFCRGTMIVEGDKWLGRAGHGKFMKRNARKV